MLPGYHSRNAFKVTIRIHSSCYRVHNLDPSEAPFPKYSWEIPYVKFLITSQTLRVCRKCSNHKFFLFSLSLFTMLAVSPLHQCSSGLIVN